jgi:amino acid adenylation domain-containing protein
MVEFDPFAGPKILGAIPSTETQREIWTAAQVSGEANLAYNESVSVHLRGELDRRALASALTELVKRHEVLRSTFSADGLSLIINESPDVTLTDVDCTARPEAVAQLQEQVVRQPFLLEQGPLLRAHLAKLGPREHVLVFTAHHIVCDGWSTAVLMREWAELYSALKEGRPSTLPSADPFTKWAQDVADHRLSPEGREEEAWWVSRFSGELPVLELPLDRPRPPLKTFASLREDVTLPAEVIAAVRKAGARERASLFAMLLSGFQALLARLSGQEDVVVGIPAAGQSVGGHDGLVGHCVHVLPLRDRVTPDATAKAFVAQVRKGLLDALEHQQLTFGSLLNKLPVRRDPSRLPLVSVLFNVDRGMTADSMPFSGLTAGLESNARRFETYDLFVNAVELGPVVKLECQYNTDLFDAKTVRRWMGAYEKLLAALARALEGGGEAQLGSLEVLSEEDATQISAWNAATRLDVELKSAAQLFERQVERAPDAVAVDAWTYRRLDDRANAVAAKLRELGVKRGDRVGLRVARDPDMVAALFGVLKAGAAYVPMDPGFPAERLQMMEEDAGLKALITPEWLKPLPPSAPRGDTHATPDDPCYVIYTSGSTGKPKGVVVPHRAVANFLASMKRELAIGPSDAMLAVTTLSFDIAVLELYLPLVTGARVIIATREDATDGALLRALAEQATFMQATPATWRLLLEAGWSADPRLTALIGGEALPLDLAKTLARKVKALWNMYGPTETTVWSTMWRVPEQPQRVLIGKPIANTQCHVLDASRRPVPIGVVGELYIGGLGVTLGYHARPELNAERFVEGLYRTGDLARWLADGTLECLGRNDFQVKLRGYRIELGEIEEALNQHPSVRQAAVVLRELSPSDKRLVGYVVAREGQGVVEAEVRAHLKGRLPEYMVPAHLVTLEKMPLTPNGKIDRKALPQPDFGARVEAFVAPRTPTEVWLAGIWQELLKAGRVGVTDDFFALGGHSLLAAQLMARLGRERDVKLSMRRIFEAPTVEKLAALVDGRAADAGTAVVAIPKRSDPRKAPQSLMQRRLWLLDQLGEGDIGYNTPAAYRLPGKIDVKRLEHAFSEMSRRHETLRTSFDDEHQLIDPDVRLKLEHETLKSFDEVPAALQREADHVFDLKRAPIARAKLFKISDEDHVLFFMPHHIVWDGWSFDLFLAELSALYAGTPLPEPEVQYGDFAAWHNAWLTGPELQRQADYWLKALQPPLATLELQGDHPRPARMTGKGGFEPVRFSKEEAEALAKAARALDATPYMVLLAAFDALLYRYTGTEDLLVGTPVRGRSQPQVEKTLGFFVNTLVLRTSVSGAMRFDALVASVKKRVLETFQYPDMPFELLVEKLKLPRDASRTPVFQALFSFQEASGRVTSFGDIPYTQLHVMSQGAMTDLVFWLLSKTEGLVGGLSYNADIFDVATAQRFLKHLRHIVLSAIAEPTKTVAELDVVTEDELKQVRAWNATTTTAEVALLTAERLFETQVDKTPDAVAVVHAGVAKTYRELDGRANAVAARLRTLGVKRSDRIGIRLERGHDMVAALFGVLKTGAAYVPMDPGFPEERLKMMAEDAALAATVDLDFMKDVAPSAPRAENGATPNDACYVIYTSGSTGRPKGVAVPHRAVVNFLKSMQREPGIGPSDALLAVTTLSFDIAVLELYLPLISGARVVLASREDAVDGARLKALLEDGVTMLQATPATWRLLLDAGWQGSEGLTALIGGEALPLDLARTLTTKTRALWNMYGPTETTVWSTLWKVPRDASRVLIGKPIDNTHCHVLDARKKPVPLGVAGELYIGGLGVALGYHGRPELTAERFVDGMYKTGDLARWLPDGTLECLGRNDFQVKLRGYRIELGEIEEALNQHPMVRQAAVVLRELSPTDKRLVAYVVPRGEADLKAHLKTRLPEYMVPAHFVTLEKLPLTPNGKIDRKALPAVDLGARAEAEYVAARTPTEEWLTGVWKELLKTDRVGVHDDFFALGGHSLLAAQLMARLSREREVKLSIRRVFDAPTVAGLAALIDGRTADAGTAVVQIPKRENARVAPQSLMQRRLWYLAKLTDADIAYNNPSAIRVRGALDVAALERALAEISRRHETLRTSFDDDGETPVQRIDPDARLKLELETVTEAELADVLQREANAPLDLRKAPVARAKLFSLASDDHVFFFMPHHIVWDGASYNLFLDELSALYAGEKLSEPEVQYGDFAAWHNAWLKGGELERQASYWLGALKAPLGVLDLAGDRPRPATMTGQGGFEGIELSKAEWDGVTLLARRLDATPYMVLFAAFDALLHRYTGVEDLLVGTPVRGRSQPQLEKTLGFFVNTLVLRAQVGPSLRFDQLVAQVKQRTLEAFSHPDMPFELLVERLKPPRDNSRTPVFQALFSYLEGEGRTGKLGALTWTPVHVMPSAAMTDLALWMVPKASGLSGGLSYNADIFDVPTAQRFLQHLRKLLMAAVDAPSRPIAELALVTESERALLTQWNDATARPLPPKLLVHEMIAARDAVAVSHGGTQLTYAQLLGRAHAVAQALVKRGVTPGDLVGLCVERSCDMLAAMIGILETGAAFVPLDPAYPEDRIAFMVEDAKLKAIITEQGVLEELSFPEGVPQLLLTDIEPSSASAPDVGALDPESAAYVIYTSGSTGKPKGVIVPHRAVANFLQSMAREPGLTKDDVLLAVTTLSFDIAELELWLPLTVGARVVIASRADAGEAERLEKLMAKEKPTLLQATPVTWRMLLDSGWAGDAGLKALVGGEALPLELARRLVEKVQSLWNMYGPTETTVWSTLERVTAPVERILIGRPIDNTTLHVLDAHLQPVPLGVAGELYIGGAGVTKGYLHRPELTAERFVRGLYRTGDLARMLPDGRVEHLGRNDGQVKVRGHRIEVGEIEARLDMHESVREACVVARADGGGEKRLVAYVVPKDGHAVEALELRKHVRRALPDYMVPAVFEELKELPRTPNGKIDRKALPAPTGEVHTVAFVAPKTPAEVTVAEVWTGLLKVPRAGAQDNFFDLGGHSLLAFKVISELERRSGGARVSARTLMLGTLEQVAKELGELKGGAVPPRPADPQQPATLAEKLLGRVKDLVKG